MIPYKGLKGPDPNLAVPSERYDNPINMTPLSMGPRCSLNRKLSESYELASLCASWLSTCSTHKNMKNIPRVGGASLSHPSALRKPCGVLTGPRDQKPMVTGGVVVGRGGTPKSVRSSQPYASRWTSEGRGAHPWPREGGGEVALPRRARKAVSTSRGYECGGGQVSRWICGGGKVMGRGEAGRAVAGDELEGVVGQQRTAADGEVRQVAEGAGGHTEGGGGANRDRHRPSSQCAIEVEKSVRTFSRSKGSSQSSSPGRGSPTFPPPIKVTG